MSIDRRTAIRGLGVVIGATLLQATAACSDPGDRAPARAPKASRSSTPGPHRTPVTTAVPDGLPLAVHDAVVPALLPGPDAAATRAGLLERDLALAAHRGGPPVAVLPARNFLRERTVVAAVTTAGDWTLVLTPARRVLPSAAGPTGAPAQTAAWARTADLPALRSTGCSVTVRVGEQTMTVRTPAGTTRHEVGVGREATPTPTDVHGYLQARYVDPTQGTDSGAIQLTSLHATAADEPYLGTDGGLIAVHASPEPRGRSSHGCIRVRPEVLPELDALPLGTPVAVLP